MWCFLSTAALADGKTKCTEIRERVQTLAWPHILRFLLREKAVHLWGIQSPEPELTSSFGMQMPSRTVGTWAAWHTYQTWHVFFGYTNLDSCRAPWNHLCYQGRLADLIKCPNLYCFNNSEWLLLVFLRENSKSPVHTEYLWIIRSWNRQSVLWRILPDCLGKALQVTM